MMANAMMIDDDRHDARRRLGLAPRHPGEVRAQQRLEDRLAHHPQRQAGEGDPHLRAGDVAVQVIERRADRLRRAAAGGHELFDAGPPNAHQRELRRHEEAVRGDQRRDRREKPRIQCFA
jgi:hypothetical protein